LFDKLDTMSSVEVVGLNYYPIKSCGPVEAQEVALNDLGIEHDREWMLVGKNKQFLSQRTHPELALVRTRVEDGLLIAEAPAMGELPIPLERDFDAEVIDITLFKKPGGGSDAGAEASAYFSDYLGKDARLMRIERPRTIKPECHVDGATTQTGFADGFPLLLASVNSLASLNRNLEKPIAIDRFRSNIVVAGESAYDEDYWREVQINNLRAFVVRACARCPVPNIDQHAPELTRERPVTDALRATRSGIDPIDNAKGEFFGQNLAHIPQPGSTIRVGDEVLIVDRADERNVHITS
jgi:MOSC domain-containing protein